MTRTSTTRRGPVGPQGPQGDDGPAGPPGAATAPADSGFITAGNLSVDAVSWQDVSGVDLPVAAQAGDLLEVCTNFMCDTGGGDVLFDAATIVGGTPLGFWSSDTTVQRSPGGLGSWYVEIGKFIGPTSPAVYTVKPADVVGGAVTVRLLGKAESGTRLVRRNAIFPLRWWVKNIGAP
jgi:hypothetical protein